VRDNIVVGRPVPAKPQATLKVGELNAFLKSLPDLGETSRRLSMIEAQCEEERQCVKAKSRGCQMPNSPFHFSGTAVFTLNRGIYQKS
jgi:hypothetical protein